MTVVDRYYLAWAAYQGEHGHEPKDKDLSQYLADRNIVGRGGTPISPSTLRRYLLEFRVFAVWAGQREHTPAPGLDVLVKGLAERGVTGQYGHPLTDEFVEKYLPDFERRWAALTNALVQHPCMNLRTAQSPVRGPCTDIGQPKRCPTGLRNEPPAEESTR